MNALDLFTFKGHNIRVVALDGDPWFVAADVCAVLGYGHVGSALRMLDDDMKGVQIMHTLGGDQRMTVISEPGLYRLTMRSQRPEAREFERWVVADVLPTIRRTGSYSITPAPVVDVSALDRRALALMVIEAEDARLAAEAHAAALAPRAEAWDDLVDGEGDYLVGDAAKILCRVDGINTGQNRLFRFMAARRWIYRADGDRGPWRAMQTAVDAGWLTERVTTGFHVRDGEDVANPPQVRVTTRGIARLRVLLLQRRSVTVIGA